MTWSLFSTQTLHLVGPTAELHPVTQNTAVFGSHWWELAKFGGSRNNSTWIATLDWSKKNVSWLLNC